jgi:hypothetical protein
VAANILAQNHHLPGAAKCGGVDGAGLMVQVLMRGDLVEGSPNRRSRYGTSALHLSQWPQRLGEAFDAAQSYTQGGHQTFCTAFAGVAGFSSEWWPASNRNPGRHQFGIPGRNASESALLLPQ